MIATDQMTDEQLEQEAFGVLIREFGAGGFARFLRLHRSGSGNYTLDRDQWQKDLTIEDIAKSILEHRQNANR